MKGGGGEKRGLEGETRGRGRPKSKRVLGSRDTHIISDLTSILPRAGVGWCHQLASEIRPSSTIAAVVASEESWFSRWNVEYIAARRLGCGCGRGSASFRSVVASDVACKEAWRLDVPSLSGGGGISGSSQAD